MATAIPPTSPTPVTAKLGTAAAPPDNLGGTTVNVGSNPGDLQAAVTAAVNGDGTHKGNTLVVPAGVTYTPVNFPVTTGNGWTAIRSNSGSLPAFGTRVSVANVAALFKVQSLGLAVEGNNAGSSRALRIPLGSNGWRITGMEATHPTAVDQYGLLDIAGTRVIIERSYLHPHSGQTFMPRISLVFGADVQVWDSWLEAWALGQDAQALFFRGTQRAHIQNCELRGTGENVLVGDQDSATAATDLTFLTNHFFKPLTWRQLLASGAVNPSWDGQNWVIKNLFEVKFGHRILVEGNVFENSWGRQGQDGTAILCNCGIGTFGQQVDARDLMFRSNIIKNAPHLFTVANGGGGVAPAAPARLAYVNNLGLNIGGWFAFFNHAGISDLWLEHNTVVPLDGVASIEDFGGRSCITWSSDTGFPRQTIRRNLLGYSSFGLFWDGHQNMTTALADTAVPDRDYQENAVLNGLGGLALAGFTYYGTHAATGVNATTGELATNSPFKVLGSDGKDLGVDFVALTAAQIGTIIAGDTTPPSVPTNLDDGTPGATSYTVTWTASTDDVAVASYEVEITAVATGVIETYTTFTPSLVVTSRTPGAQYSNRVRAQDTSGNLSAYTSPVVTTMDAGSTGTPAPPDLMRGFGSRGVAATDRITVPLTTHASQRTRALWFRPDGIGPDRVLVSKAGAEELVVTLDGGVPTLHFRRQWLSGLGDWAIPVTPNVRQCLVVTEDTGAPTNVPTFRLNDNLITPTVITQPTASVSAAWQANGGAVEGVGTLSPAWPAHQAGDIALLLVQTSNQVVTETTSGWVEVPNSPQGIGTGGAADATRLTVFWKRADSAAEANAGLSDSGDHQIAQIVTFRGCIATGNPWDVTAGDTSTSSATVTFPNVTTTVPNALLVCVYAWGNDSADPGVNQTGGWSGSSTPLTRRGLAGTVTGTGGGFAYGTGLKAATGLTTSLQAGQDLAGQQGRMTIALKGSTGIPVTNSNPYVLGNDSTGLRPGQADLGKWAVWDSILSAPNQLAYFEGTSPLTIATPVAYHPLAGEALEPDGVTTNPSTIVGTLVQNYAAAPTATISLSVDLGEPATGNAYSVLAITTGSVNRVEFWVDGALFRSDTIAPYTLFATTGTLGAGSHSVEGRVFTAAGGTPADVDTLSITEGIAVTTNSWQIGHTWPRDPNAVGGYKYYVNDVLTATITQSPLGTDPNYTLTVTGADIERFISVACLYAGAVEGPKRTVRIRKKAATTSGVKAPGDIQELFAIYTP